MLLSLSLFVGDQDRATVILYVSGRIVHTLINHQSLGESFTLRKSRVQMMYQQGRIAQMNEWGMCAGSSS